GVQCDLDQRAERLGDDALHVDDLRSSPGGTGDHVTPPDEVSALPHRYSPSSKRAHCSHTWMSTLNVRMVLPTTLMRRVPIPYAVSPSRSRRLHRSHLIEPSSPRCAAGGGSPRSVHLGTSCRPQSS